MCINCKSGITLLYRSDLGFSPFQPVQFNLQEAMHDTQFKAQRLCGSPPIPEISRKSQLAKVHSEDSIYGCNAVPFGSGCEWNAQFVDFLRK